MPEALERQFTELQTKVGALREILEAKFSPEQQGKEKADLLAEVKKLIEANSRGIIIPAERKMVWAVPGKEIDKGKALYLAQFLKAITPELAHTLDDETRDNIMANIKTVMSEGTPAQGGYTVPTEYTNEIIKLERDASISRRLCRLFPMGSLTRKVPRQITNVTVTWTDEATAKTPTKPTFDQLTQTAKKLAAIVKFTDELLEDNSVDLDRFVMELIAEAMGIEEDRVVFAGNTGAGDPFMGVLYAAGVNSASMVGTTLQHDDLIDFFHTINAVYRSGGTLVTSTTGLGLIMKLKDQQGNYLWQLPAAGQPPRIWTYPYEISDQIPTNLGTNSDQTALLFGNWKKYYWMSDRGGYEVKSSIAATDLGTNESAFMQDETWFRFKKRMSLDCALPAAFVKMLIK